MAWHKEKSGVFSVRSAYRFAFSIRNQLNTTTSSSSSEADDRSIWDIIWKAKVLEKVKVFGWRVATGTLATKRNRWKRTLESDNTCNICVAGEEDEFHAVVTCTKSRGLIHAMRNHWNLPRKQFFRNTG